MHYRSSLLVLAGVWALGLCGPALSADNSASSSPAANGPNLSGHGMVTAEKKPPLQLSEQQQQTVVADITAQATHQATPKEFTAKVGEPIPKAVEFHGMPPSIVSDVPELKNYAYAHLDGDILIVDPLERKIAAMIPLPKNLVQQSSAPQKNGKPDQKEIDKKAAGGLGSLSPDQERAIYQSASAEAQPVPPQPMLKGAQVPDSVKLQPLPANATAQTPQLQNLSYAKLQDGRVLLVDPASHKVAGIITRDEGMGSGSASGNPGSTTGQK
jgi:hypothetical protein